MPAAWSALWESGPEAPAPWIKQAVARMVALQGWAQQLEGGGLLRGAVRLNELLNPGFFLTALRQQTARVSQLPLNPYPSPTPSPTPSPSPNPEPNPKPTLTLR